MNADKARAEIDAAEAWLKQILGAAKHLQELTARLIDDVQRLSDRVKRVEDVWGDDG